MQLFSFCICKYHEYLVVISIISIMICQAVIFHVLCGNCGILQFHNAQPLCCYKSNSSLGSLINIFYTKGEWLHSHKFERIFIITSVALISSGFFLSSLFTGRLGQLRLISNQRNYSLGKLLPVKWHDFWNCQILTVQQS